MNTDAALQRNNLALHQIAGEYLNKSIGRDLSVGVFSEDIAAIETTILQLRTALFRASLAFSEMFTFDGFSCGHGAVVESAMIGFIECFNDPVTQRLAYAVLENANLSDRKTREFLKGSNDVA